MPCSSLYTLSALACFASLSLLQPVSVSASLTRVHALSHSIGLSEMEREPEENENPFNTKAPPMAPTYAYSYQCQEALTLVKKEQAAKVTAFAYDVHLIGPTVVSSSAQASLDNALSNAVASYNAALSSVVQQCFSICVQGEKVVYDATVANNLASSGVSAHGVLTQEGGTPLPGLYTAIAYNNAVAADQAARANLAQLRLQGVADGISESNNAALQAAIVQEQQLAQIAGQAEAINNSQQAADVTTRTNEGGTLKTYQQAQIAAQTYLASMVAAQTASQSTCS